jgi:hypothetical protein
MGLSNAEHEVLSARPDELQSIMPASAVDAYVVGIDDPIEALDLVTELRAIRPGARVLLVAGRAPGWTAVAAHNLDATEVIPLPVTRPALLDALDRLLSQVAQPNAAGEPPPEAPIEQETPSVKIVSDASEPAAAERSDVGLIAVLDEPKTETGTREPPEVANTSTVESIVPIREVPEPMLALADVIEASPELVTEADGDDDALHSRHSARVAPPHVAEHDSEGTVPLAPSPYGDVAAARISSHRERAPALDLTELRTAIVEPSEPPRPHGDRGAQVGRVPSSRAASTAETPATIVRALLAAADGISNLSEVGEIVVVEAVNKTGATAGALLLPDGDVWRVAGGVRLRPLETRCQLEADSWLVETVAHGDRGVIIEDTDIARQRLHGAPMANRNQLVAAPVPEVHGVLLLGRDEVPFDEAALQALAAVGREAVEPLQEALDARELARRLENRRDLLD